MRRALFGGSFDPFHNGHLAVVETLLARGHGDEVWLAPAGLSPGKPPPRAAGRHRAAMARLGLADLSHVELLDLELRRPGPSYTVDTLSELGERHPGDHWLLVVGADAWRDFDSWRDPDRILDLARVLVFPRGGIDPDPDVLPTGVALLADFSAPASSSQVRRRLRKGVSAADLLPPTVLGYIRRHGLYAGADDAGRGGG